MPLPQPGALAVSRLEPCRFPSSLRERGQRFTHLPIALVTAHRKQLDPQEAEWYCVLQSTGQPAVMVGKRAH